MLRISEKTVIRISFLVALVATLGSLYFSEVMKLPPCVLCWYQRICMYPLALLFGTALWADDERIFRYTLPLSNLGFLIASYHMLLYYGFIEDSIVPCTQGVSCTSKQIEWLGFITIPLLSWISFLLLNLLPLFRLFGKDSNEV
jgi:disulfide bond formation protein DsbB